MQSVCGSAGARPRPRPWCRSRGRCRSRSTTGASAIARAMASRSKAARSVRAPPPRTRHTTSNGGSLAPAVSSASRIDPSAAWPCTRASNRVTCHAWPLPSSVRRKSWAAALPSLVTNPMRSGTGGKGRAAWRLRSPSACKVRSKSSRASAKRPSVYAVSIDSMRNETRPRSAYQRHSHSDAHLGAVRHAHRSAGAAEHGVDDLLVGRPQRHAERTSVADEVEVDVARRWSAEVGDLAADPHLVRECPAQHRPDVSVQLRHRQRRLLAEQRLLHRGRGYGRVG